MIHSGDKYKHLWCIGTSWPKNYLHCFEKWGGKMRNKKAFIGIKMIKSTLIIQSTTLSTIYISLTYLYYFFIYFLYVLLKDVFLHSRWCSDLCFFGVLPSGGTYLYPGNICSSRFVRCLKPRTESLNEGSCIERQVSLYNVTSFICKTWLGWSLSLNSTLGEASLPLFSLHSYHCWHPSLCIWAGLYFQPG